MSPDITPEGGTNNMMVLPFVRHVMSIDWREQAACADLPKAVFFDYNEGNIAPRNRKGYKEMALNACSSCPVRQQCYEFAVCNNEQYGIWAGTFPKERKALHKEYSKTGVLSPLP